MASITVLPARDSIVQDSRVCSAQALSHRATLLAPLKNPDVQKMHTPILTNTNEGS